MMQLKVLQQDSNPRSGTAATDLQNSVAKRKLDARFWQQNAGNVLLTTCVHLLADVQKRAETHVCTPTLNTFFLDPKQRYGIRNSDKLVHIAFAKP